MRWLLLSIFLCGCFGSRSVQRSFYVLHSDNVTSASESTLKGLLRVRDLDAESVYDKFQIVIRSSPWELRYSGANLWAVRPNVMVSDVMQASFRQAGVFSAVIRDLTEARPDFVLGGDLNALEVYDSEEIWYAHLAMTLRLTRFSDGEQLWRYEFDDRKMVKSREMAHAVRAMSELLQLALRRSIINLLDTVEGVQPMKKMPSPGVFFEPAGPRPKEMEAVLPGAEPKTEAPRPPAASSDAPFIVRPSIQEIETP